MNNDLLFQWLEYIDKQIFSERLLAHIRSLSFRCRHKSFRCHNEFISFNFVSRRPGDGKFEINFQFSYGTESIDITITDDTLNSYVYMFTNTLETTLAQIEIGRKATLASHVGHSDINEMTTMIMNVHTIMNVFYSLLTRHRRVMSDPLFNEARFGACVTSARPGDGKWEVVLFFESVEGSRSEERSMVRSFDGTLHGEDISRFRSEFSVMLENIEEEDLPF